MEKFFTDYPAAGWTFVGGLLVLIGWLVKMAIQNNLAKIQSVEKKATELENNYKEEFKKVREESQEEFKKVRSDNNDKHLIIMGVLTEVRIEIAELKGNISNN